MITLSVRSSGRENVWNSVLVECRYFCTMRNISMSNVVSLTEVWLNILASRESAVFVNINFPATFLQAEPRRIMGGILGRDIGFGGGVGVLDAADVIEPSLSESGSEGVGEV